MTHVHVTPRQAQVARELERQEGLKFGSFPAQLAQTEERECRECGGTFLTKVPWRNSKWALNCPACLAHSL